MAVQASHETKTVTVSGPSGANVTLTLGPRPYNRFLGNPPAGRTAEECFKDENGYDWVTELNAQPYLDLVNKLETQLMAAAKSSK